MAGEAKSEVTRWVTRLIDFGKYGDDAELNGMTRDARRH